MNSLSLPLVQKTPVTSFGSAGFQGVGLSSSIYYYGATSTSFPLTSAQLQLPPVSIAPPYNSVVYGFAHDLELPYTMQWNLTVEQALGKHQQLSVGYVGSAGRNLLAQFEYNPSAVGNPNFQAFDNLFYTQNLAVSNYNALQVEFQRQLSSGLQALVSYTWSHSIDNASTNFQILKLLRGSSDFDVRQNFQLALTYDVPGSYANHALSTLLRHWGLDARVFARSALPVDILGGESFDPATHSLLSYQPDLVQGQPLYMYASEFPGGRAINYNAFIPAPAGVQGNVPRNFARAFDAVQADIALRRDFPITERLRLQFRAEAFNLFNHPNFGTINNQLSDGPFNPATKSGFGVATNTLNNGLGGLNPLYQVGGPRSIQFSLRLVF